MVAQGNLHEGRVAIEYYGCASCHEIPGACGANGLIGPSLDKIRDRTYIAGVLPNSPENLIRWIQNAPSVNPKTAMPDLEVPEQTARNIAAYLYTLR